MFGLVQPELSTTGNSDEGHQAEARLLHGGAFHSLALQFLDGLRDVVTHQVQLVMDFILRRVYAKFSRRQRKNEPAMSSIYRAQVEDIAKEGAHLLCIIGIDKRMNSGNHGAIIRLCLPLLAGLRMSWRHNLYAGLMFAGLKDREEEKQDNHHHQQEKTSSSGAGKDGRCAPGHVKLDALPKGIIRETTYCRFQQHRYNVHRKTIWLPLLRPLLNLPALVNLKV